MTKRTQPLRRNTRKKLPRRSLDPTKVRLSKYFMLSDFMGCDSVYRNGLCNRIYYSEQAKVAEGIRLAHHLDKIEEATGLISVSYGFISPALSQCIVTYQNPNMPSFHRWDLGAACDIRPMLIDWTEEPPICTVSTIVEQHKGIDYARIITYSESPWICFATSTRPAENSRRIHEYRYTGVKGAKADWRKWQGKEAALAKAVESGQLVGELGDWVGAGRPTYHGYGREQYQHIQLSEYVNMSDLLYSKRYTHLGIKNRPPEDLTHFYRAAKFLDRLYTSTLCRVSIVGAYEAQSAYQNRAKSYKDGFYLELIPPQDMTETIFRQHLEEAAIDGERIGVDDSAITVYHVRG